jgi:plastocyanin
MTSGWLTPMRSGRLRPMRPGWLRLRLVSASLAVGSLVLGATSAFAIGDVTSVSIVDAPRPQPRWGYTPGTRKIAPGTWVTWSNDGQDEHTVTAADGSFDSGDLDPSEGFSWFFDQPGTFTYVCTLHPWMTGTVIVGDGVAPQSAPPTDDSLTSSTDEIPAPADSITTPD